MAFVNEYISEKDTKKYKIDDSVFKYNPLLSKDALPSDWKPMWTVDKVRGDFFIRMNVGREELSNRVTCMFFYNGHEYKIEIDNLGDGKLKFSDTPYLIIWGLVKITPLSEGSFSHKELIASLKEALTIYGYGGIRKQIPNTIVKFTF